MKKVVLDTNVTISALFWGGPPRDIYNLIRSGKLAMLVSEDMKREFIRVLGYNKFGLSAAEIMPLISSILAHANPIIPLRQLRVIAADPTDNIFLECAVEGNADFLVSGDADLLNLDTYQGVRIVRSAAFWEVLEAHSGA